MPFGFPAATTIRYDTSGIAPITCAPVRVKSGDHVSILGKAAEQDGGRLTEVLCITKKGVHVMIEQNALNLG